MGEVWFIKKEVEEMCTPKGKSIFLLRKDVDFFLYQTVDNYLRLLGPLKTYGRRLYNYYLCLFVYLDTPRIPTLRLNIGAISYKSIDNHHLVTRVY